MAREKEQKKIIFECEECGFEFDSKIRCEEHEKKHVKTKFVKFIYGDKAPFPLPRAVEFKAGNTTHIIPLDWR